MSHLQLCVSPPAQRQIWLCHAPVRGVFGPALSLNLMETPSLDITNVKKQSLPMAFKPLLLKALAEMEVCTQMYFVLCVHQAAFTAGVSPKPAGLSAVAVTCWLCRWG